MSRSPDGLTHKERRKKRKMAETAAVAEATKNRPWTRGEIATPERDLKAGAHLDVSATGVQRISDAPFDWMAVRGLITFRQTEAGERFRNIALIARAEPSPGSVDWNSSGVAFGPKIPSMFTSQAIADARGRYRNAVAAVGPHLEPILDAVLIREHNLETSGKVVCGYRDRRAAIAAAGTLLRVALDTLADHFRLRDERKPKRSVWRAEGAKPIDTGVREFPKMAARNKHKGGSA